MCVGLGSNGLECATWHSFTMCVLGHPGGRRACAHPAFCFGLFQTSPTQTSPPASAYPEPDPLGTCHSPPNPEPPENSVIFRIWPSAKADRGIGPVICRCRALPLSPPVSGSRRTACYKQNLAPLGGCQYLPKINGLRRWCAFGAAYGVV